jgi:hypothetical protein
MLRKSFRIARQYVLASAAVALLGSTLPAAGCGSQAPMGLSDNAGDTTRRDLTWVKTNHPIYFAIQDRGIFRLKLNSNIPEPLGIHNGAAFSGFRMSASGRYLIYQTLSATSGSSYIYDLDRGLEQQIFGFPQYSDVTISPDNRYIAAISPPREPAAVWLLNLKDGKTRHFTIPSNDAAVAVFGKEWSTESSLLFGVRDRSNEVFWSFTPDTGDFSLVRGVRTGSFKFTYFKGSTEVQTVCESCRTYQSLSTVNVAGGTVVATPYSLVFRKSGSPDREIAALPPPSALAPGQPTLACGPTSIHLSDVIDDDYLLFSVDDSIELYGINENRTALLPIPPHSLIASK